MAVTKPVTVVFPLVPVMATRQYDVPVPVLSLPASGLQHLPSQLDLAHYLGPRGESGHQGGVAHRHARARDDQRRGAGQLGGAGGAGGDFDGDASTPRCRRLAHGGHGGKTGGAAVLEHHDLIALFGQPGGGGAPAEPVADDQCPLALSVPVTSSPSVMPSPHEQGSRHRKRRGTTP